MVGSKRWVSSHFCLIEIENKGVFLTAPRQKSFQLIMAEYDMVCFEEREEQVERFRFNLAWGGQGTKPSQKVWEFYLPSAQERDDWIKLICLKTGKTPKEIKLETLDDGSGKILKTGSMHLSTGSIMSKWVPQDSFMFCFTVEDVCDKDGVRLHTSLV